ncbi:MAG: efflux RND transporter periplasmic adaptor subunit [Pseudomonadota bacterium]
MSETKKTPLWRRTVRHIFVMTGTLVVGAIAVGLVIAGSGAIAARNAEPAALPEAQPLPVAVTEVLPQESYEMQVDYFGLVEPRRRIDLGFEAGGTLEMLEIDEGAKVTKGQVLATLDTRALTASRAAEVAARDALVADRDLAALTADRQQKLASENFSSQQRADEARFALASLEARIAQSDARIAAIDIDLDKAVLRAPFAALVGARAVDPGQRLSPGQPVLDLLEDTQPQFRVGLPADVAAEIVALDEVQIEFSGMSIAATPETPRTDINPLTRTVSMLFSLDVPDGQPVPFGLVGRISHARELTASGAWVPLSALSEGERGLWTLYVISDDGPMTAEREVVELVYANDNAAFVRGAFAGDTLVVSDGAHRLANGQSVALIEE